MEKSEGSLSGPKKGTNNICIHIHTYIHVRIYIYMCMYVYLYLFVSVIIEAPSVPGCLGDLVCGPMMGGLMGLAMEIFNGLAESTEHPSKGR